MIMKGLNFLDRVLNLIVSHYLFKKFPEDPEGELCYTFGTLQALCTVK
jgi:dsRNA-specific ribonuclease